MAIRVNFRISTEDDDRKVGADGRKLIMADITFDSHRLRISSEQRVLPQYWDPKKKRNPIHRLEENAAVKNAALTRFELKVVTEYDQLASAGPVDKLQLKLRIAPMRVTKRLSVETPAVAQTTVWDLLASWKKKYQHRYSDKYLAKWDQVEKWVRVFLITNRRSEQLLPAQITDDFIEEYCAWLVNETPLVNNSISTHIKFFRKILQFARLPHDWIEDHYYEKQEKFDLTHDEVIRLYETTYISEQLRETADMFVFLCHVALRYSDFLSLDPSFEQEVIVPGRGLVVQLNNFRQHKTGERIDVVLPPRALEIWRKYAGRFPFISSNEFNIRIKECARAAKLTRRVHRTHIKGKQVRRENFPLHRVISAHIARHTAGSLTLQGSGLDEATAQDTLGHRSRESTRIYAKPKEQDVIERQLKAWENLERAADSVTGAKVPVTESRGKEGPPGGS